MHPEKCVFGVGVGFGFSAPHPSRRSPLSKATATAAVAAAAAAAAALVAACRCVRLPLLPPPTPPPPLPTPWRADQSGLVCHRNGVGKPAQPRRGTIPPLLSSPLLSGRCFSTCRSRRCTHRLQGTGCSSAAVVPRQCYGSTVVVLRQYSRQCRGSTAAVLRQCCSSAAAVLQ